MSTRSPFLEALEAVSRTLEALDAPSMIIGGIAVIAHGVPRSTVDVDATVLAHASNPAHIAAVAARHGLLPRIEDAAGFAQVHQVLLLRHETSGVPVDISLAWLPFEETALASCVEVTYESIRLRIPRPEDLLIYKLAAARPRDIDDAEQLLLLHGAGMNLTRVRTIIGQFADLLEDPERVRTLDQLLKRTGLE